MKQYQNPYVEVIEILNVDILTVSVGANGDARVMDLDEIFG